MLPSYELARSHHADALREVDERRLLARRAPCRRRILGLPIGRPACRPS